MPALILASTSRYRKELLGRLGVDFTVGAPEVDETTVAGESPLDTALRLARLKALAVAAAHRDAVVIGSDQTATLDGVTVIGKPGEHARAVEQLRVASGRMTDLPHGPVGDPPGRTGFERTVVIDTRVRFRTLVRRADRGLPGSRTRLRLRGLGQVEGLGIALLEGIDGSDPTALVGLPLIELTGPAGRDRPVLDRPLPSRPAHGQPSSAPARLFLIPTPLGQDEDPLRVLPPATVEAVVDARRTSSRRTRAARAPCSQRLPLRRAAAAAAHRRAQRAHDRRRTAALLAPVLAGRDAGLLSEAGCPAVADPGAALVASRTATACGCVPLVGPSALLLALMASGMNGQRFCFAGYVPVDPRRRDANGCATLERRSAAGDETVLIIETPYRTQRSSRR